MARKRYKAEEIIGKRFDGLTAPSEVEGLREAEVLLSKGQTVGQACRQLGVTEQTYYRWRKEYGGMRVEQASRLKDLEKENAGLKKLVADLSLDNQILKEAAEGNF